jgi:hypothetical protein
MSDDTRLKLLLLLRLLLLLVLLLLPLLLQPESAGLRPCCGGWRDSRLLLSSRQRASLR